MNNIKETTIIYISNNPDNWAFVKSDEPFLNGASWIINHARDFRPLEQRQVEAPGTRLKYKDQLTDWIVIKSEIYKPTVESDLQEVMIVWVKYQPLTKEERIREGQI